MSYFTRPDPKKAVPIEDIEGNLFLNRAIHIIRKNYEFEESDLDFIICGNAIIPKGRERIFRKGIYAVLEGDCYTAVTYIGSSGGKSFSNTR